MPSKRPSSAYCMASLAQGTWHFCQPQQALKHCQRGRALARPQRFNELLVTVVPWNVPRNRLKCFEREEAKRYSAPRQRSWRVLWSRPRFFVCVPAPWSELRMRKWPGVSRFWGLDVGMVDCPRQSRSLCKVFRTVASQKPLSLKRRHPVDASPGHQQSLHRAAGNCAGEATRCHDVCASYSSCIALHCLSMAESAWPREVASRKREIMFRCQLSSSGP